MDWFALSEYCTRFCIPSFTPCMAALMAIRMSISLNMLDSFRMLLLTLFEDFPSPFKLDTACLALSASPFPNDFPKFKTVLVADENAPLTIPGIFDSSLLAATGIWPNTRGTFLNAFRIDSLRPTYPRACSAPWLEASDTACSASAASCCSSFMAIPAWLPYCSTASDQL